METSEQKGKYYTPIIEEFHQGFEYERWLSSEYTPEKYIKEIFEFVDKDHIWDDDVTNMLACAYNGGDTVRVKYLDQEDIESLGWGNKKSTGVDWYELEGHFEDGWSNYGYWNFLKLLHDKTLNRIKIIAHEYKSDNDENVLFQGSCKNKSEFKKVMKQLNILKNE